jgi:hypothetical protein
MFLLENAKFEHNHNKNRFEFHLSIDGSESDANSHNSWLLWRKISLCIKDAVTVSLFSDAFRFESNLCVNGCIKRKF